MNKRNKLKSEILEARNAIRLADDDKDRVATTEARARLHALEADLSTLDIEPGKLKS